MIKTTRITGLILFQLKITKLKTKAPMDSQEVLEEPVKISSANNSSNSSNHKHQCREEPMSSSQR
jgi:hypothetical protein